MDKETTLKNTIAELYVKQKRYWQQLKKENKVEFWVIEYRRGIVNGLLQACIETKAMDEVNRFKTELGVE